MRVFTNEDLIKRNRRLAQILFFASLIILIGGLVLTNTLARSNYILMALPVLAMPIGLITTWISVRLTNQYVREPHPENAIQTGLKGASHNTVLYNYLFKANHVLITPQGVFAIITRFQDGVFTVKGDKITSSKSIGPLGWFFGLMRQDQLGKPITEARTAAADLQKQLDAALPNLKVTVQPVVLFVSEKAQIETADGLSSDVPVVLANSKKKPSLKGLLREGKKQSAPLLSPAQLRRVEDALNGELSIGNAQSQVVVEDEA